MAEQTSPRFVIGRVISQEAFGYIRVIPVTQAALTWVSTTQRTLLANSSCSKSASALCSASCAVPRSPLASASRATDLSPIIFSFHCLIPGAQPRRWCDSLALLTSSRSRNRFLKLEVEREYAYLHR